jgi:hypothetical protein
MATPFVGAYPFEKVCVAFAGSLTHSVDRRDYGGVWENEKVVHEGRKEREMRDARPVVLANGER